MRLRYLISSAILLSSSIAFAAPVGIGFHYTVQNETAKYRLTHPKVTDVGDIIMPTFSTTIQPEGQGIIGLDAEGMYKGFASINYQLEKHVSVFGHSFWMHDGHVKMIYRAATGMKV